MSNDTTPTAGDPNAHEAPHEPTSAQPHEAGQEAQHDGPRDASSRRDSTFLGLRTAIYHAADLDAARVWYSDVLGIEPYFNEPFYVGFDVAGYELGLVPDAADSGRGGVTVYWGVAEADAALAGLLAKGATADADVQDVGGGIRTASVLDPWGNVFGIIENPHFTLP